MKPPYTRALNMSRAKKRHNESHDSSVKRSDSYRRKGSEKLRARHHRQLNST